MIELRVRRTLADVRVVPLVVVIVLGLSCATGSDEATEIQTDGFFALSYNVAGLPEPLSSSEPATNTPLISPLLNSYDLVLVQEDWVDPDPPHPVFDLYHDDLISEVDHPFFSTSAESPLGADPTQPTALVADGLNRLSRFAFGDITRERWPSCFGGLDTSDGGAGDCLAQKGFSVARTEFAPGVEIDVYNLHAEAGSTALDIEYREEGFATLAAFIEEFSAGRPIILGGDTNLHTADPIAGPVWEDFKAATGLVDVCDVLDCGDDADQIDKFAFRSAGEITVEPLSHSFERDVFVRDDGEPLSDHDALAVEFQWTRPA